jgi:hypothetical protein
VFVCWAGVFLTGTPRLNRLGFGSFVAAGQRNGVTINSGNIPSTVFALHRRVHIAHVLEEDYLTSLKITAIDHPDLSYAESPEKIGEVGLRSFCVSTSSVTHLFGTYN